MELFVKEELFVKFGDILVGKVTPKDETDQLPEGVVRAIFGEKNENVSDNLFTSTKRNIRACN